MNKIFKCFVISVIISLVYAVIPSYVEAVENFDKIKREFEQELMRMDEKDVDKAINDLIAGTSAQNIDQYEAGITMALRVMERKFEAEEKSLEEIERQKRREEIEKLKLALWIAENLKRRKLELAEEKHKKQESQQKEQEKEEGGLIFNKICKPVLSTIFVIVILVVFVGIVCSVLGPWGIALLIFYGIWELCQRLF